MINDQYVVDTDSRYPLFSDIYTSDYQVSYQPAPGAAYRPRRERMAPASAPSVPYSAPNYVPSAPSSYSVPSVPSAPAYPAPPSAPPSAPPLAPPSAPIKIAQPSAIGPPFCDPLLLIVLLVVIIFIGIMNIRAVNELKAYMQLIISSQNK